MTMAMSVAWMTLMMMMALTETVALLMMLALTVAKAVRLTLTGAVTMTELGGGGFHPCLCSQLVFQQTTTTLLYLHSPVTNLRER